ncbi:DUF3592 domain-containing protein [Burkholderia cepacia]|nr:DUF3592 domain-containing protein [Burkholderia cepacia]
MNIATVIAMIIGAAVLAFCIVQAYRTTVFLSHASRAPGVVVKSSGHPTIRFETAQGQRIEFVQNGGMDGPPGTVVQVAYDPAAPAETARAATFLAIWGDVLWECRQASAFWSCRCSAHGSCSPGGTGTR